MKKYWKPITVILAILLVAILIVGILLYYSVPRLSKKEKEKVEQAYFIATGSNEEWYKQNPIIWYDENGYVEENNVWRYLGVYGDCYAFLRIGDNINMFEKEIDLPWPIQGFDSPVYYPVEADVMLYHTKQAFTHEEVYGTALSDYTYQLWNLYDVRNRNVLLTDAQLERLTRDIEKLAKAHD